MAWLNEEEQRVLRLVAGWFEQNRTPLQSSEVQQEVGIDHQQLCVILRRLGSVGAVKIMHDLHDEILFRPSASAVDAVRELNHRREEERSHQPDIIQQFTAWVRRKPWLAWPIIGVMGLTFLVTLLNQCWELVGKVIQLFRPPGG